MRNAAELENDRNPFLTGSDPHRDFFPYETIDYAARVEVLDRSWTAARETRRQLIRFREDGTATFLHSVWGDGVLFANYNAPTMRIIDAIPTRKGYVVVLGLPRPFYAGEEFEVVIERKIVGPFLDELNYWESILRAPAQRFSLDVIAPRGAGFRAPEVILPPRREFDAAIRSKTFQLSIKKPAAHEPYRLSWLKS